MATRKPLVLVNGQTQELPVGDDIGIGAGSRTIESATITIPHQVYFHEEVVNRPGTLPTEACQVWLAGTVDSDDNSAELLEGYALDAVCEIDQVRFIWRSLGKESGAIKLNYEVI